MEDHGTNTSEVRTVDPPTEPTEAAENFDPKGTLAMILIYFGMLILMWIFIYFVEFLGNDLTVVG